MSRTGVPMYSARQRAHIIVTVEAPGEQVRIREWSGSTCTSIKKSARAKYGKGVYLGFGACFYKTR